MEIALVLAALVGGAVVGAKVLAPAAASAAGGEQWWVLWSDGPTTDANVTGSFLGYGEDGKQKAVSTAKEWFDTRFQSPRPHPFFTAWIVEISGERVASAHNLEYIAMQEEAKSPEVPAWAK